MIIGRQLIERMYSEDYERAFCEGYECAQREFGKKENKDDIANIKDHEDLTYGDNQRGLGRAVLLGQGGGAVGRVVGKREYEKQRRKGLSRAEASKKSEKKAAIVGGATNAGLGAVIGGALGTAGSYLGTKKNNKERRAKSNR